MMKTYDLHDCQHELEMLGTHVSMCIRTKQGEPDVRRRFQQKSTRNYLKAIEEFLHNFNNSLPSESARDLFDRHQLGPVAQTDRAAAF